MKNHIVRYLVLGLTLFPIGAPAHADQANTYRESIKESALELIAAELSGVHIDGMEDCLAKNTFQLNKIGPDVYGELSLAVVQRVDLDTVKIGSIEKIDPYLENYRVAFSVEAFDGEGMVEDNIVMSINSETNRARYGFANLIKSTDRMLLRSDCDLLVANDNESS